MAIAASPSVPILEYAVGNPAKESDWLPLPLFLSRMDGVPIVLVEQLNVTIRLCNSNDVDPVSIFWDDVETQHATNRRAVRPLQPGFTEWKLFDNGQTQEYPWSVGVYCYEVNCAGQTYHGQYEIVPKNVDGEQWQSMHRVIDRHVAQLSMNTDRQRKNAPAETAQRAHGRERAFLQWYISEEPALLRLLRQIAQESEQSFEAQYMVERIARRQTNKSLQWAAGSHFGRHEQGQFLNRKMVPREDESANRHVKFQMKQLCAMLERCVHAFERYLQRAAAEHEQMQSKWQKLVEFITALNAESYVDEAERQNHMTTNSIIQKEMEKLLRERETARSLKVRSEQSLTGLLQALESPFWRKISDAPPTRAVGNYSFSYKMVQQIWLQAKRTATGDGVERTVGNALRPTAVLYEYFVFFKTIDLLCEALGCRRTEDNFYEHLQGNAGSRGLPYGSYVILENDQARVKVTYNETIAANAALALRDGTHFYSAEPNREPDIRIDMFRKNGQFRYSIILEVKYRPFHYLYNSKFNTSTMRQMNKYWAIGYVAEENHYVRNMIKQVICVYPGKDARFKIVTKSEQGLFVQFAPLDDKEIYGQRQLQELFQELLD